MGKYNYIYDKEDNIVKIYVKDKEDYMREIQEQELLISRNHSYIAEIDKDESIILNDLKQTKQRDYLLKQRSINRENYLKDLYIIEENIKAISEKINNLK